MKEVFIIVFTQQSQQQRKILQSPTEVHTIEYNRNYLRNAIIALIRYKKPVIVTAMLQFNPYEYYYSFIDVKPFYPQYKDQLRILCQHVNISKKQVEAVLDLYNGKKDYTKKPLVLICRPYIYRIQSNGEDRGGLNLTAELGIPGIMTYENALQLIPKINSKKYIDFKEFAGGYFLGIDPVEEKRLKSQKKYQRKLLNKKMEEQNNAVLDDDTQNDDSTFSNNLNISNLINVIQFPKENISMLDGWFLRI